MDLNTLSDRHLVTLASQRHQAAQQLLYRRYAERMYSYFLSQTRNTNDAEDLTQETFVRAFNGLEGFRGTASFKNWLYRIAKNQLADFYRDMHSKVTELDEALPPRQLRKNLNDDELVQQEQKIANKAVSRIFFHLPDRYKKVLTLRFLKGFSLKETAETMGLTLANAKVLQHRALKMARQKTEVDLVYE